MSLLIKGMDMPKCCLECPCCFPDDYSSIDLQCGALNILNGKENGVNEENGILKNCLLTDISTPHGRLIDADRLIAVLKSAIPYEQRTSTVFCVIKNIENAPTIIEAEG